MVRKQIPKPFPLRSPILSTGSFVLGEQVLEEQRPLCSCTAGLPGAQKEQWLWLLRITGRGWQGAHSKLDGARNPHHAQTQELLWKLSGRPRTPSFCSPSLQSQELQVLLSTNSLLRAEKEKTMYQSDVYSVLLWDRKKSRRRDLYKLLKGLFDGKLGTWKSEHY